MRFFGTSDTWDSDSDIGDLKYTTGFYGPPGTTDWHEIFKILLALVRSKF